MKQVPEHLRADLLKWLEDAYPHEGCGLILLHPDGTHSLTCCENHSPTPLHAYAIDPLVLLQALSSGAHIACIFHSHPDQSAVFSPQDAHDALIAPGTPAYPDTDYLVVAVRAGHCAESARYRWSEEVGGFEAWSEKMS